jgi:hypothetical protein
MTPSATSILHAHWLALGGATSPPDRLAINADSLGDALASTVFLEVPDLRVRTVCTNLYAWLHCDWRQTSLADGFDRSEGEHLQAMGAALAEGFTVRRIVQFAGGRRGTLLLLPLTIGLRGTCRAVGAIDYPGPVPPGPARIIHADHLRLVPTKETV